MHCLILIILLLSSSPSVAKELPIFVELEDVEFYDDVRIVTTGTVESIEIRKGRTDSLYIYITLVKVKTNPFSVHYLIVLYPTVPLIDINDFVLVQGTYQKEGKAFGLFHENFMLAEIIIKE